MYVSSHSSRDILPYARERDSVSTALAQQSNELQNVWDDLTDIQGKAVVVSRANVSMTSELLDLTGLAKGRKFDTLGGIVMEDELKQAGQEARKSRQRWKVIKGTVSAVIVGSGIDWAHDPELVDIVLDPSHEL